MIKACFYLKDKKYFGFQVSGHAGYDEPGKDIVCSAVSALTINTVNALEELTSDSVIVETEESGDIKAKILGNISPESETLIKALRIGLCNIYEEYEDDYIKVFFKEV